MVNQGSIEHTMERHRRNKNIGASEKHSKSAANPNLHNALTLDLPGRSLSAVRSAEQGLFCAENVFVMAGAWDTLYGQGWRDKSELCAVNPT